MTRINTTQQELDITQLASYLAQAENVLEHAQKLYELALPNGTRFYAINFQEITGYVTQAKNAIRLECQAIDAETITHANSGEPSVTDSELEFTDSAVSKDLKAIALGLDRFGEKLVMIRENFLADDEEAMSDRDIERLANLDLAINNVCSAVNRVKETSV